MENAELTKNLAVPILSLWNCITFNAISTLPSLTALRALIIYFMVCLLLHLFSYSVLLTFTHQHRYWFTVTVTYISSVV